MYKYLVNLYIMFKKVMRNLLKLYISLLEYARFDRINSLFEGKIDS